MQHAVSDWKPSARECTTGSSNICPHGMWPSTPSLRRTNISTTSRTSFAQTFASGRMSWRRHAGGWNSRLQKDGKTWSFPAFWYTSGGRITWVRITPETGCRNRPPTTSAGLWLSSPAVWIGSSLWCSATTRSGAGSDGQLLFVAFCYYRQIFDSSLLDFVPVLWVVNDRLSCCLSPVANSVTFFIYLFPWQSYFQCLTRKSWRGTCHNHFFSLFLDFSVVSFLFWLFLISS